MALGRLAEVGGLFYSAPSSALEGSTMEARNDKFIWNQGKDMIASTTVIQPTVPPAYESMP